MGAGADSRDFFGIAQGMDEGRYVGFSFGKKTSVFMDSSLLLIEPLTAAGFADLVEEVVLQFTAKPGVKVRIAIEIQAETETAFDDNLSGQ